MLRHVLVVEDDEAFRRMVIRMLAAAGFEVTTAEDFTAAVKLIEGSQPIDLLLTDIGMPVGTPHGISIARIAQMRRDGLKVLFMTGQSDAAGFALLGKDDHVLQKPFTQDQLTAAIAAALR